MIRYSSQPQFKAPRSFWSVALLSAVLLGGVSQEVAMALPQTARPLTAQLNQPQSAQTRLPWRVAWQVKRDLSERLNQPWRNFEIVSFSRETWPDSCLGLAAPNERCAMATVEGWRVELTNGEQNWVYRTDGRAEVMKLETRDRTSLPPDVMDRLLLAVAQEVDVPASTLRVTETQPASWDGCMGIYDGPNQPCTKIAISGWRVILAGEEQSWVYHVSEDGSRIVQNPTASGSQDGLVPSFIPEGGHDAAPLDESVVFRVTVSGRMAGMRSETVLMADGTLYRQDWQFNEPITSDPVIEKRLSREEVEQFQQALVEQKFLNLDGLRYITDAAFADYPTTTLEAMGSTVQYIDLEQDNLPPALQAVLQAWEGL